MLGTARNCSELLGTARNCSELLGGARNCSVLLGDTRNCSELFGGARNCSELLGTARNCSGAAFSPPSPCGRLRDARMSSETRGNALKICKIISGAIVLIRSARPVHHLIVEPCITAGRELLHECFSSPKVLKQTLGEYCGVQTHRDLIILGDGALLYIAYGMWAFSFLENNHNFDRYTISLHIP